MIREFPSWLSRVNAPAINRTIPSWASQNSWRASSSSLHWPNGVVGLIRPELWKHHLYAIEPRYIVGAFNSLWYLDRIYVYIRTALLGCLFLDRSLLLCYSFRDFLPSFLGTDPNCNFSNRLWTRIEIIVAWYMLPHSLPDSAQREELQGGGRDLLNAALINCVHRELWLENLWGHVGDMVIPGSATE